MQRNPVSKTQTKQKINTHKNAQVKKKSSKDWKLKEMGGGAVDSIGDVGKRKGKTS